MAVGVRQTPVPTLPLLLHGRSCLTILYWTSESNRQNTGLFVPFRLVPQDSSAVRFCTVALPRPPSVQSTFCVMSPGVTFAQLYSSVPTRQCTGSVQSVNAK